MSFLSKIPQDELYRLYYIEHLTHDQIGQMYGVTRGAVQARMNRLGWKTIPRVARWDNGKPTGKAWQILLGTVMGDGHLYKPHTNVRLELKHGVQQREYLEWKTRQLAPWIDFTYQKEQRNKFGADTIHAVSLCYPWLTELHNRLYKPDGTRLVDRDILDQLGELGLAVWYLDDGTYNTIRWNNYIILASLRYGKEGNEIIAAWLEEEWGLKPNIYHYPNRKEKFSYCLQFTKANSEKIREMASIITTEVPSMRYKVEKAS